MSEETKWKFKGGVLCLDFINTVYARIDISGREYNILNDKLNSYADLVEWSVAIGLMDSSAAKRLMKLSPQKVNPVLKRGIEFREALYRIFKDIIDNRKPLDSDLNILNKESGIAKSKRKLAYTGDDFTMEYESFDAPDSMLWHVAVSAAELLLSDKLNRIKQCPAQECGWLFLDTCKNNSRTWCDMKDCGNVEKVRRFRKKNN